MEKIVKSARQTKKTAFVVAMISFGIALAWTIMVTVVFVMGFSEAPETCEVCFGGVAQTLKCDESMQYGARIAQFLYDLNLSFTFGLFGLATLMISRINRDLEKDGPFGSFFVNNVRNKMIVILACGAGYWLYRCLVECYACENLNYNTLATSGSIVSSEYNGDFPLIILVVIAVSLITTVLRILRYGAELQKQADETL